MHNLTKIRLFRILLLATYPIAILLILPLVLLKKKNKGRFFFFFDRYGIGGAQRVHLDILTSVSNQQKQVYFTRHSPNYKLKQEFYSQPNADVKDIHFWCDNLLIRLFSVHYYAFYLNRHADAHVFSSNSTFFYDMLFFLNRKIIKSELLHNFTYGKKGMEFFGLYNYKRLDNRLTVDPATRQNIIEQYKKYNIPPSYCEKIHTIEPGVVVPSHLAKSYSLPLKVLYAGRGGVQKRIPLLNAIAEKCLELNLPVIFHFAGTMMDELSERVKQNAVLHGEISRQADMYNLYNTCHATLMTSAYEGFPMLVKESMACGCIPVVTALDGNKSHLRHEDNALLIFQPEIEQGVIEQGLAHIIYLTKNLAALETLSTAAYIYAGNHFDKKRFIAAYRHFLTRGLN